MDCPKVEENLSNCTCTYEPCSRKGHCCECVQYHVPNKELPACAFSSAAERSYDRSFRKFIEDQK